MNSIGNQSLKLTKPLLLIQKSLIALLLLLLTPLTASAQKIDQRLTRLAGQASQRSAKGYAATPNAQMTKHPDDQTTVCPPIAVRYNADGTIAAFSAIATLKQGTECPAGCPFHLFGK